MTVPVSPSTIISMVEQINLTWDEVDRANPTPARRHETYRPHDGTPRCITLDHPWFFEVRPDGYHIVNAHTLQSARVRPVAAIRGDIAVNPSIASTNHGS